MNVDRPDPTCGVAMDPALWELYESGDPADELLHRDGRDLAHEAEAPGHRTM